MNPRIQNVEAHRDYTLTLTFTNGEVREFDVKPYLRQGIFQELQDLSRFLAVAPYLGSIRWKTGQDFCPDTLYLENLPRADNVSSARLIHQEDRQEGQTPTQGSPSPASRITGACGGDGGRQAVRAEKMIIL